MKNDPQAAHNLIPADILPTLPCLYATEHQDDPVAHIKLFTPDGSWTWFITEYDPEQRLCFGLVHGEDTELGYFSLDDLQAIRGGLGLPVERDLSFTSRPLSQCRNPCSR